MTPVSSVKTSIRCCPIARSTMVPNRTKLIMFDSRCIQLAWRNCAVTGVRITVQ